MDRGEYISSASQGNGQTRYLLAALTQHTSHGARLQDSTALAKRRDHHCDEYSVRVPERDISLPGEGIERKIIMFQITTTTLRY